MTQGDQLIFETNRNQTGKYWCLAENGLNSTVNASASLDVQCKYMIQLYPDKKLISDSGKFDSCKLDEEGYLAIILQNCTAYGFKIEQDNCFIVQQNDSVGIIAIRFL